MCISTAGGRRVFRPGFDVVSRHVFSTAQLYAAMIHPYDTSPCVVVRSDCMWQFNEPSGMMPNSEGV